MALQLTNLVVRSLDTDRNEVTWEVQDTQDDALDYALSVWRSESPEGPWDQITDEFEDRYIFVDSRVPSGDRYRQLWYQVRSRRKADDHTTITGPAAQQADPDLIATYIRRMEMTLFTHVVGRRCWLFKRRTFGARCPSCWDVKSGRRTRSGCLDCYATSFLRGYHNPIEISVQLDPSTKSQQLQSQQKSQYVMTSARTGFYPNIGPGDVLIEMENRRWTTEKVTPTERLRAVVRQELVLREIVATDIEYRLPLNLDRALRDIQPSPPRMFTNPTDLNSAIDERIDNLFANYPGYPEDGT